MPGKVNLRSLVWQDIPFPCKGYSLYTSCFEKYDITFEK